MPLHSVSLNQSFSIDESLDENGLPFSGRMKAKVMYDYCANAPGEISVSANEVFNIYNSSPQFNQIVSNTIKRFNLTLQMLFVEESTDADYFIARKGTVEGKVPKSCILIL